MDVESPKHLERLRDLPEIKVALLRMSVAADSSEARFERTAKGTLYWPPVRSLATHFAGAAQPSEIRTPITVYGRSCWLLATMLAPAASAPYVIAVAAADGAEMEAIIGRLREVSHDYWYGSYFFK